MDELEGDDLGMLDRSSGGADPARKALRESLEAFLTSLEASGSDLIDVLKQPPSPEDTAKQEADSVRRMTDAGLEQLGERERYYSELKEILYDIALGKEEAPETLGLRLKFREQTEELQREVERRFDDARTAHKKAHDEYRRRIAKMEEIYQKALVKAEDNYKGELKRLESERAKGPAWLDQGDWVQEYVLKDSESWKQQCRQKRIFADLKYYARRREILKAFDRLKEKLFGELWEEERRTLESERVQLLHKIEHLRAMLETAENRERTESKRCAKASEREAEWSGSIKSLREELGAREKNVREARGELAQTKNQLATEREMTRAWIEREKTWLTERDALETRLIELEKTFTEARREADTERARREALDADEAQWTRKQNELETVIREREKLRADERRNLEAAVAAREQAIEKLRAEMLEEQARLQAELKGSAEQKARIWDQERSRLHGEIELRESRIDELQGALSQAEIGLAAAKSRAPGEDGAPAGEPNAAFEKLRAVSRRQSDQLVALRKRTAEWKEERRRLLADLEERDAALERFRDGTRADAAGREKRWRAALRQRKVLYERRHRALHEELGARDAAMAKILTDLAQARSRAEEYAADLKSAAQRENSWREERDRFLAELEDAKEKLVQAQARAEREQAALQEEARRNAAQRESRWAQESERLKQIIKSRDNAAADLQRAHEDAVIEAKQQAQRVEAVQQRLNAQEDEIKAAEETRRKSEKKLERELSEKNQRIEDVRNTGAHARAALEAAWKAELDSREQLWRKERASLDEELRLRSERIERIRESAEIGALKVLAEREEMWKKERARLEEELQARDAALARAANDEQTARSRSEAEFEEVLVQREQLWQEERQRLSHEIDSRETLLKELHDGSAFDLASAQKEWQDAASRREEKWAAERKAFEKALQEKEQALQSLAARREEKWDEEKEGLERALRAKNQELRDMQEANDKALQETLIGYGKSLDQREKNWEADRKKLETALRAKEEELVKTQVEYEKKRQIAREQFKKTFDERARLEAGERQKLETVLSINENALTEALAAAADSRRRLGQVLKERDRAINDSKAALQAEQVRSLERRADAVRECEVQWDLEKLKFKEDLRQKEQALRDAEMVKDREVEKAILKARAGLSEALAQRDKRWKTEQHRLETELLSMEKQAQEARESREQAHLELRTAKEETRQNAKAEYGHRLAERELQWAAERRHFEEKLAELDEALQKARAETAALRAASGKLRDKLRSEATLENKEPPAPPAGDLEDDMARRFAEFQKMKEDILGDKDKKS